MTDPSSGVTLYGFSVIGDRLAVSGLPVRAVAFKARRVSDWELSDVSDWELSDVSDWQLSHVSDASEFGAASRDRLGAVIYSRDAAGRAMVYTATSTRRSDSLVETLFPRPI